MVRPGFPTAYKPSASLLLLAEAGSQSQTYCMLQWVRIGAHPAGAMSCGEDQLRPGFSTTL
jgi:hypothetical protein